MSIKIRSHTIEVGEPQNLEQAQGEDCEFRLSFTDSAGAARDLTGAQSIVMTVRDRASQTLIFARSYSGFVGGVGTGAVRFQILQADTMDESVQPYDVDVVWTDSSGYREQLLVKSTFDILDGIGEVSDPLTIPPAQVVTYRLLNVTSLKTTGYGATYGDFVRYSTVATGATMIMPQSSGYGGQVVLAKVATGATLPLNIVATGLYDRIDGTTGIAIYPLEALTMTSDGIGGWMVI